VGILFKSYTDEIRSFIEASLSRELQVSQRSALVFFNCSISSEVTSTPRYIFGNLIKQLLVHCSAIPSFDRHTNALCSQFASFLHLPLPEKIYQIVSYLSAYLDEIYFVLDGLDECPSYEEVCTVLQALSHLPTVKILVVSQEVKEFASSAAFTNRPTIQVDRPLQTELVAYVRSSLVEVPIVANLGQEVVERIVNRIVESSGGRYVSPV